MTDAPEERQPLNVECRPCGHEWPAAYTPMEAGLFARVLKAARCPMCGSAGKDIFLAKSP